jgi:hypothetical protein
MRPRVLAGLVLFVSALTGVGAQAPEPEPVSLSLLLGRGAWYVNTFIDQLSNVVSEERYLQDSSARLTIVVPNGRGMVSGPSFGQSRHRELKSDFLLVRLRDTFDWVPFRDVFEVDGIPVRDREQRLARLFLKPSDDAIEQANRIRDESARFNLGTMLRTINNPVLSLLVLEGEGQQRFRFSLGKIDTSVGPNVWIIEFKEQGRPTMISGRGGMDLFAYGRLWIEASTGRVVKSELSIDQPSLRARVITVFRHDEQFGIDVPFEMTERYSTENLGNLTATATYGRFRKFGVSTDEQLNK